MSDDADAAPGPKRPARVRILEAMMTLDDHRSVHEHTVDELAAIAGVAKGSVYYQFGSKDRLVREMLVHGGEELRVMMDAAAERTEPRGEGDDVDADDDGERAGFAARLRAAVEFLDAHPSFTGLVAFALARRRDDEAQQLRAEKESIVALLADQLASLDAAVAAVAGRAPASRTRLEITATGLLSAAVTLAIDRHTTHPEWGVDDCVEALVAMVSGA
ncbi:TetR/AcrR family transcriptional regulator [Nesterenkonia halophila]|uniref:TetR/AcrR family transcriptional regulator n=1 Tax=Nesterenkonia halophila TaxID=302044 RepID=UPI0014796735|nr:TetR/AcrR family transcriptional regulator [Nesterenkonia halophila]